MPWEVLMVYGTQKLFCDLSSSQSESLFLGSKPWPARERDTQTIEVWQFFSTASTKEGSSCTGEAEPPAAKRLCHHRNAKLPQPCHSGSLELHCSWELSLSSPECSLLTSYPPTSLNCRLVSAMLGLEDTSLIRMIVDDISLEYGFLVRERWWCWVRYKDVLMGNQGLVAGKVDASARRFADGLKHQRKHQIM